MQFSSQPPFDPITIGAQLGIRTKHFFFFFFFFKEYRHARLGWGRSQTFLWAEAKNQKNCFGKG
jgi:hypothetical protein